MFDILRPFMGSMIRHALTTIAGALVTYGVLRQSQTEAFVSACFLFAGIVWSAWHKINTPEMLSRLTERMKAKNVKAAWAGDIMKQSPNVIVVFGICGVILAALASSAGAQAIRTEHRPGGAKIIHIEQEPMKAGLGSLINQALPVPLPILQGPDQLWANLDKLTLGDLEVALANATAVVHPTAA